MFQEFQCCVSRVSGLCFKSFNVVFQEFQGCVSRVSGLCIKSFIVVFQEIQGCVSGVLAGYVSEVSRVFRGVFQEFQCCVKFQDWVSGISVLCFNSFRVVF